MSSQITTADWTPPWTEMSIDYGEKILVEEKVKNGDFTDGLNHWNSWGEVSLLSGASLTVDGQDKKIVPPDQESPLDKMVVIQPSVDASGENEYYSSLSQTIPSQAKNLSFWYNFATYDYLGFDNPGFTVSINGKQILQVWAEDVADLEEEISFSGWKRFYYDLTSFEEEELELVFKAGNKGSNTLDSWVYLDEISTRNLVVNQEDRLFLESKDEISHAKAYFKRGNCSNSELETEQYIEAISISQPTEGNKFCYWSVDDYQNKEPPHEIGLIFDADSPEEITDLQATNLGGDLWGLQWTAPDPNDLVLSNNQAAGYILKYSLGEIDTETDFQNADQLKITAPRPTGKKEIKQMSLPTADDYYFAIKTFDAAGNLFGFSD